jgi:hypothetical protein
MRTLLPLLALVVASACAKPQPPAAATAPAMEPAVEAAEPAEPAEPTPVPTGLGLDGARAEADAQGWRACDADADCAIVRCRCSCSGCGGFSADDTVNTAHVDDWYTAAGCSEALVCPMVCCQPRDLVCLEGQCAAVFAQP